MSHRPTRPALRALLRGVSSPLAGGSAALAFLPALTLAAYWLGGERLLLLTAVLVPAAVAAGGLFTRVLSPRRASLAVEEGLAPRDSAVAEADAALQLCPSSTWNISVIAVGIDDAREFADRFGPAALALAATQTGDRLASVLRPSDHIARLGEATFAIVLAGPGSSDLEALLQICRRIQAAVAEPLAIGGTRVYLSASLGLARAAQGRFASGEALVAAAETALADAAAHGPGGLRSHASGARPPARAADDIGEEIAGAIASGQIVPWFQPQVRADTGALSGAEALARWAHPSRGLLLPSDFLREAEDAGLSERLGAAILHGALSALKTFDAGSLEVPRLSVNFSPAELRDPGLADRVRWELDRFALAPHRLVVEVLETVIEKVGDDVVTRNLSGLAALGCGIDLDDFGAGHAAIGSIRRFSVQRIKIDRSFVRRIDTDPDQQAVVSAMLLMSDQLGLDTLAEGVETAAEHAALLRLGCRHVQGFAVARPMPEAAFTQWLSGRDAGGSARPPAPGRAAAPVAGALQGKTA